MSDKKSKGVTPKKRSKTNEKILDNTDYASEEAESSRHIPCEHLGIGALVQFDASSIAKE